MSDQFDVNELLQQAMAMQERMQSAQADAAKRTVEGSAGGGLVKITFTGGGEPVSVSIAPGAVDLDDLSMLEDLVLAALRDTVAKAQALQSSALGDLGDLGGLGKLLGG
jgi:DNA-binding YbaB/EbfC family protein